MSLENIPTNSYMLWLKENRDDIKSKYFSNYSLKIIDGRKESIVCLLAKKTGEIWRNMDKDIKENYKTRLNNMNLMGYYIDPQDDTDECEEEDEEMEVDELIYKGETYYVELSSGDIYDVESGDVIGHWEGDTISGSPTFEFDLDAEIEKTKKMIGMEDRDEEEDETSNEENGDMYKSEKIYCPNNCGSFRKTLNGMYSHLGLSLNSANNCKKKQKIQKKKNIRRHWKKYLMVN